MKTVSKAVGKKPPRGPEALTRLQGAYHRVFFAGGASQDDRDIVLADMATWTNYFFVDGAETSAEKLHQMQGKRAVFMRVLRLGFGEKTDLSALFEAAVAERETDLKTGKIL